MTKASVKHLLVDTDLVLQTHQLFCDAAAEAEGPSVLYPSDALRGQ